ncbi:MAG: AI-2E family transporter [Blautia sp.]|nr:AI-2E family transporter [Lachnoclostridium sp.]MCM1212745.1 AI-2E family transporter [Blautia sp.]
MGDWNKEIYSIFQKNKLVRFGVITLLVYLFFRYIFTLIAPFCLAFILITLFYPLLQRIQRKIPMKKKSLAVGVLLLVLAFLAILIWALGYSGSSQLGRITEFIEKIWQQIQMCLHRFCYSLDGKFGFNGYEIENYFIEKMTVIMENVQVQVIPRVLSSSYNCFKGLFEVVAFLFFTFIAAILLEKDYAAFMEWLKTSEDMAIIWKTLEGILNYLLTFLKAQGVILLIISILCSAVLWAAGISGSIFFGILAGCLDVLPFIGTGVVLVPVALWQLLNGYYIQTVVCLLLYVACIFIREFLEPKLIGGKLGIAPVLMLLAIYAGVRLFGIGGIIKGPLALITIYELMKG